MKKILLLSCHPKDFKSIMAYNDPASRNSASGKSFEASHTELLGLLDERGLGVKAFTNLAYLTNYLKSIPKPGILEIRKRVRFNYNKSFSKNLPGVPSIVYDNIDSEKKFMTLYQSIRRRLSQRGKYNLDIGFDLETDKGEKYFADLVSMSIEYIPVNPES
ncbi:hypothetical protein WJR50_32935 [Catalinimonas sp. 4WD22]|uniref:hypothetical protein n=1 Tax=Catalinimonas locisalis TaxID=3133978 RepID=UPI003101A594